MQSAKEISMNIFFERNMAAVLNAKALLERMSEIVPQLTNQNESCKGCGECCQREIYILGVEALKLIGKPVTNNGSGCPFLKKEGKGKYACSVYDDRPLVCRFYGFRKPEQQYLSLVLQGQQVMHFGVCNKMSKEVFDMPLGNELESLIYQAAQQSSFCLMSSARKLIRSPFVLKITEQGGVAVVTPNPVFAIEG